MYVRMQRVLQTLGVFSVAAGVNGYIFRWVGDTVPRRHTGALYKVSGQDGRGETDAAFHI